MVVMAVSQVIQRRFTSRARFMMIPIAPSTLQPAEVSRRFPPSRGPGAQVYLSLPIRPAAWMPSAVSGALASCCQRSRTPSPTKI